MQCARRSGQLLQLEVVLSSAEGTTGDSFAAAYTPSDHVVSPCYFDNFHVNSRNESTGSEMDGVESGSRGRAEIWGASSASALGLRRSFGPAHIEEDLACARPRIGGYVLLLIGSKDRTTVDRGRPMLSIGCRYGSRLDIQSESLRLIVSSRRVPTVRARVWGA
jgi:hypothetical protein